MLHQLTTRVPQGSAFGPLIFSIYQHYHKGKQLVSRLFISRLDYCNLVLAVMQLLQLIQNIVAHLVFKRRLITHPSWFHFTSTSANLRLCLVVLSLNILSLLPCGGEASNLHLITFTIFKNQLKTHLFLLFKLKAHPIHFKLFSNVRSRSNFCNHLAYTCTAQTFDSCMINHL